MVGFLYFFCVVRDPSPRIRELADGAQDDKLSHLLGKFHH
jgi:hypothetical protein